LPSVLAFQYFSMRSVSFCIFARLLLPLANLLVAFTSNSAPTSQVNFLIGMTGVAAPKPAVVVRRPGTAVTAITAELILYETTAHVWVVGPIGTSNVNQTEGFNLQAVHNFLFFNLSQPLQGGRSAYMIMSDQEVRERVIMTPASGGGKACEGATWRQKDAESIYIYIHTYGYMICVYIYIRMDIYIFPSYFFHFLCLL
jgi:hypothetical protein